MDMDIDSITPDSSYCQSDTDLYPPAGHVSMHNLNDIPEGRVSNTPPPPNIDFLKCCKGITGSLNVFSNHWCKQESRWCT